MTLTIYPFVVGRKSEQQPYDIFVSMLADVTQGWSNITMHHIALDCNPIHADSCLEISNLGDIVAVKFTDVLT